MNIERLEHAISIMKRAGAVDMTDWQANACNGCAITETELHSCGNSACFAGWVAVSPEFHEAGGEVQPVYGLPIFGKLSGAPAISAWLEADEYEDGVIHLLVSGEAFVLEKAIDTLIEHDILIETDIRKGEGRTYAWLSGWENFKADDIIEILETLKNGQSS